MSSNGEITASGHQNGTVETSLDSALGDRSIVLDVQLNVLLKGSRHGNIPVV